MVPDTTPIRTMTRFATSESCLWVPHQPDPRLSRTRFFRILLLSFLAAAIIASWVIWVKYTIVRQILDEMIAEAEARAGRGVDRKTGNGADESVDRHHGSQAKEQKRWYEMDDRKVKDYMMCP